MRRPLGRVLLTVVFILMMGNGWLQAANDLLNPSGNPPALTALQFLSGTAAAVAAWGCWKGTRWAPVAAVLYGVIAGGMVAALEPMLGLPPEARGGLWLGAATILAFSLGSAWWLRRTHQREMLHVD